MARPRLDLDLKLIEQLAMIHCTNLEIAAIIGCDPSLLSKPRFSELIIKGKEKGRMSLRRKMMDTAMSGNVVMQIWLSKQYLGMSDKVESKVDSGTKVIIEDYTKKDS